MRPATMRSRVDLPEPERPRSATISPSRSVRSTRSSTVRCSPAGVSKALATPDTSSTARLRSSTPMEPSSADPEPPLREAVERPPQQAVEQDDEQRHHGDAEQ